MIHYHGTPVSGSGRDAIRMLTGRHALIPHAYPENLAVAMDVCQSFVLDNSAYTYWKQGGEVDFDAYFKWVHEVYQHPGFDWCLIPDKIDGTEDENNYLVSKWQDTGPKALGVPVWHLHESLEWLDYLVSNFPWVALGSSGQWSSPGTHLWWLRMAEAMSVICDDRFRPRCRLHGLRMLDPNIFSQIPLSSADSTNASVNAGSISRFGLYPAPTTGQRGEVIAARIESWNSTPIWQGFSEQTDLFSNQEAKQ